MKELHNLAVSKAIDKKLGSKSLGYQFRFATFFFRNIKELSQAEIYSMYYFFVEFRGNRVLRFQIFIF